MWCCLGDLYALTHSPRRPNTQKYYFYAEQEGTAVLFMAEVSFTSSSRRLTAVIKGPTDGSVGQSFVALFKRALAELIHE